MAEQERREQVWIIAAVEVPLHAAPNRGARPDRARVTIPYLAPIKRLVQRKIYHITVAEFVNFADNGILIACRRQQPLL